MKIRTWAAAFAVFLLCACASQRELSPRELADAAPAKRLSSYGFDPADSLSDRLCPTPGFFIDYLNKMDGVDYYADYPLSAEERRIFSACLALLPEGLTAVLERKLVAVYFVDRYIGGGMADFVLDEADGIYAVLVVNPETLTRSLSDWIGFRERSAFDLSAAGPDAAADIRIDAGDPYPGTLYVLLHEGAHIADYADRHTPYVEPFTRNLGFAVAETDFVRGVWREYDRPVSAYDYPGRGELHFYGLGGKPLIPAERAESLYRSLEKTPFVSLYGSKNWAEDFAEYFVWHYLTTRLGLPYRIELYRNGVLAYSLEPMASALALSRAAAVEALE